MKQRITGAYCPVCKNSKLIATELVVRDVNGYHCPRCGADFDAEVSHDWENHKHYWVGRLKNPDFWSGDSKTFAEGILNMAEKVKNRVPEYLGDFMIESVEFPQANP